MRWRVLYWRGVAYHWRAAVAVGLGVAAGTAVLTGALLVGVSMRGSLREAALDRLGHVDYALLAPRFFRAALADGLVDEPQAGNRFAGACPLILLRGSATHADSYAAARRVSVLGVDGRFLELERGAARWSVPADGRVIVLNQALAEDLRAAPGEDVLLRIGRPSPIPTETLLGRRDDATLTLRLTVAGIAPATGLGAFSLDPQPAMPRNAYVPLATLQAALRQPERVNALLVAAHRPAPEDDAALLNQLVYHRAQLADYGLRLRSGPQRDHVAIESDAFLLPPVVEAAARAAAAADRARTTAVLAYLANSISLAHRPEVATPYSIVAAVDPATDLPGSLTLTDETLAPELQPGEILLNEWAADDLQAAPGDAVRLTYYTLVPGGQLQTQEAEFVLRGIVRLTGPAADPGFTPEYPGVTDAVRLTDWNPPFPIDLSRIRAKDEAYWDEFRTTPKAFITLADGRRLWTSSGARFGELTSLRVHRRGERVENTYGMLEVGLPAQIDPTHMGLGFEAVRARALAASGGTTDFGMLFIAFSSFLIVSAALLVALLYRLAVERRAAEIGLLLAVGWSPRRVAGLLLGEAAVVAGVAAAVGLIAARGYAGLLLAGLRSWWVGAGGVPFLRLHDTPSSYALGYAISVLVASVSIAWALRGLFRQPARGLLAGVVQAGRMTDRARRGTLVAVLVAMTLAGVAGLLAVSLAGGALSRSLAFFGGGCALLVGCVAGVIAWLTVEPKGGAQSGGVIGLLRLGLRNARRRPGRSALTVGLISAATFVITALHALHLEPPGDSQAHDSGTGGFALYAESTVPLSYDPGNSAGRAALSMSGEAEEVLAAARVFPLRLRDGDEVSCLNPYRPTRSRLLGAPPAVIERGGFVFSSTLAATEAERRNPWLLLRRHLQDGAIPAIADEAAALWQLHTRLGEDVPVADERGAAERLRLVALLKGSFLQGELIVAEEQFTRLFPSTTGYNFFLIEAVPGHVPSIEQVLERELMPFGLAAGSTVARLAELQRVQNTYLLTFQALGGLGLLLGTVGLVAVLLRSAWERRSELALLQALGFSRAALSGMMLMENAALLAAGLLAGVVSAAVAVAPHAAAQTTALPWASLLAMFAAIFGTGLLASGVAVLLALRAPLLPALRSE